MELYIALRLMFCVLIWCFMYLFTFLSTRLIFYPTGLVFYLLIWCLRTSLELELYIGLIFLLHTSLELHWLEKAIIGIKLVDLDLCWLKIEKEFCMITGSIPLCTMCIGRWWWNESVIPLVFVLVECYTCNDLLRKVLDTRCNIVHKTIHDVLIIQSNLVVQYYPPLLVWFV